ncbi:5754_t:CDS:2 [Paraglomus occultum]|uniref:5754_t:CDS:1 n=1 Tax=Paraglomus occultum TaxID=144539 RepID=A0A9N9ATR0_9GLOM|nr:5754_t:CDS:2 [Paraglomus occultum]
MDHSVGKGRYEPKSVSSVYVQLTNVRAYRQPDTLVDHQRAIISENYNCQIARYRKKNCEEARTLHVYIRHVTRSP